MSYTEITGTSQEEFEMINFTHHLTEPGSHRFGQILSSVFMRRWYLPEIIMFYSFIDLFYSPAPVSPHPPLFPITPSQFSSLMQATPMQSVDGIKRELRLTFYEQEQILLAKRHFYLIDETVVLSAGFGASNILHLQVTYL